LPQVQFIYYHAYATNTQGTGYGAQGTFTTSAASGPTIVISQIYGSGGNASATYNQDFVELFNKTTSSTIDISNWSIQYASAAGTSWTVGAIPAATTLAPGKYYLIAVNATGGKGSRITYPGSELTGICNMSGNRW